MDRDQYREILDLYNGIYENYGDAKYDPKKLEKQLPKGYSYGRMRPGKGDDKRSTMQVKDGDKTYDTDLKVGGAHGGKSDFSPSWGDGHRKNMNILKGIDQKLKGIRNQARDRRTDKNNLQRRMAKSISVRGNKALSDITGVGRKTNVQGQGNKALRRIASM